MRYAQNFSFTQEGNLYYVFVTNNEISKFINLLSIMFQEVELELRFVLSDEEIGNLVEAAGALSEIQGKL